MPNRIQRRVTFLYAFLMGSCIATGNLSPAQADQEFLDCMKGDTALSINNQEVIEWKRSTPNQYKNRARVSGVVKRFFKNRRSHLHFEIQLSGGGKGDTLEIVYNKAFGVMPPPELGLEVEACGDYITSRERAGRYNPSPSGAILHWVHINPRDTPKESGYVYLDGKMYGQEEERSWSESRDSLLRNFFFDINLDPGY